MPASVSRVDSLKTPRLRGHCRQVIDAALAAAAPGPAIRRALVRRDRVIECDAWRWQATGPSQIWITAAGKAAFGMATAAAEILGELVAGAVAVVPVAARRRTPDGVPAAKSRRGVAIEVLQAAHPEPDDSSAVAAARVLEIAGRAGANDLLLCLVSGGASSLLCAPVAGLSVGEIAAANRLLLNAGAEIGALNTVRKHLSAIKGGRLAAAAAPAAVLTLLISDVVGNRLDVIGSGLTAPDPTTYSDALSVLERLELQTATPAAVRAHLLEGCAGRIEETPKPSDPLFAGIEHRVVASIDTALDGAARAAQDLGYGVEILTAKLQGSVGEAARWIAEQVEKRRSTGVPQPLCLLSGGETTVTVRGDGVGGRNQELALVVSGLLDPATEFCFCSVGTDGVDGPTTAAGAIVDSTTVARAEALGLRSGDFLARNDSNRYFAQLGDLLETGPTGTNVMDVQVTLLE